MHKSKIALDILDNITYSKHLTLLFMKSVSSISFTFITSIKSPKTDPVVKNLADITSAFNIKSRP